MSEAKLSEPQLLGSLRRTGQMLMLGLVVAGAAAAWRWRSELHPLDLAALIRSQPAAPLVFLALHVIASLTFVPRTLLGLAAGIVFGVWWGLLWASLGGVIGAIAGFAIARYIHGGFFEGAQWGRLAGLLERAGRGGWRTIAFIRLVPVIPHSLTNYTLGLTGVGLGDYVLGSLLGQLPSTIAAVDLGTAGESAMRGTGSWLWPTIIGLTALALSVLIPWLSRRRKAPAA